MSPPPSKDWWLAAALTSTAVPGVLAQQAPARPDAVVTTVARPATAQAAVRHVQVSADAARGQKLTTDGQTAIHVLFADQSAVTIAPNSEIVLQQYSYDDRTRNGNIVIELTQGMLRMVGGFITKQTPARVTTKTATVGIRGGIAIVGHDNGGTSASFLFGQNMSFQGNDGQSQNITRPGFGTSLGSGGGGPSQPNRDTFSQQVNDFLTQLNTGGAGSGGTGGGGQPGGGSGGQGGQGGGGNPGRNLDPGSILRDVLNSTPQTLS